MKFEFPQPYEFEGATYDSFSLPDNLSGYDLMAVRKDFQKKGEVALETILGNNLEFCLMFAARFSGQPEEFFLRMPAGLYMWSMMNVSNFFAQSASTPSATGKSSPSARPSPTASGEAS